MPDVGDKRQCTAPRCPGKQVLIAKPTPTPKKADAGEPFLVGRRHLSVWICDFNPRRHVEVFTWGPRPTKDCTAEGCSGVMVHADKGREITPEGAPRKMGGSFERLRYEAGWICIEHPDEHFALGEKP